MSPLSVADGPRHDSITYRQKLCRVSSGRFDIPVHAPPPISARRHSCPARVSGGSRMLERVFAMGRHRTGPCVDRPPSPPTRGAGIDNGFRRAVFLISRTAGREFRHNSPRLSAGRFSPRSRILLPQRRFRRPNLILQTFHVRRGESLPARVAGPCRSARPAGFWRPELRPELYRPAGQKRGDRRYRQIEESNLCTGTVPPGVHSVARMAGKQPQYSSSATGTIMAPLGYPSIGGYLHVCEIEGWARRAEILRRFP